MIHKSGMLPIQPDYLWNDMAGRHSSHNHHRMLHALACFQNARQTQMDGCCSPSQCRHRCHRRILRLRICPTMKRRKRVEPAGGAYFLPGAGKKSAHP